MKCSICGKETSNWIRREDKIYCVTDFRSALDSTSSLSTHPTEEANLRKKMNELGGNR